MGMLPRIPALKQGYTLYSLSGCRLGYHQLEAWLAEQNALLSQLYTKQLWLIRVWVRILVMTHVHEQVTKTVNASLHPGVWVHVRADIVLVIDLA